MPRPSRSPARPRPLANPTVPEEAACVITRIQRFAVKGLSSDGLRKAELFPRGGLVNDRRFAFIFARAVPELRENKWLHKANFVSVFATRALVAGLSSSFDDDACVLSVWRRGKQGGRPSSRVHRFALDRPEGREEACAFFSERAGERVELVDGADTHQFGNTGQGLKANGELRTLHVVNANTVRAVERATGVPLDPRRFRPNLVIDGFPAWSEFGWVGKDIRLGGRATLRVIGRTVRCSGVGVSSEVEVGGADDGAELDLVQLLSDHFPEHGPYLGIYAQVVSGGAIEVGDAVHGPSESGRRVAGLRGRLEAWLPCGPQAPRHVLASVLFVLFVLLIVPPSRGPSPAPPPVLSPHSSPWRGPPTAPPSAPPEEHDEDHEVLCDCGWTRVPGQSCAETRGKPDFGCWSDCCAQHEQP